MPRVLLPPVMWSLRHTCTLQLYLSSATYSPTARHNIHLIDPKPTVAQHANIIHFSDNTLHTAHTKKLDIDVQWFWVLMILMMDIDNAYYKHIPSCDPLTVEIAHWQTKWHVESGEPGPCFFPISGLSLPPPLSRYSMASGVSSVYYLLATLVRFTCLG